MEAERILNQHKFTVLWSGGKDSTAALLWVLDPMRARGARALTMNDPEWRAKILPVLVRHREKLAKGSIGRSVYSRWITGAMQSTITLHPLLMEVAENV
jgi:diphthamide synthase (EF-2-diphthine--ammonia ligase)